MTRGRRRQTTGHALPGSQPAPDDVQAADIPEQDVLGDRSIKRLARDDHGLVPRLERVPVSGPALGLLSGWRGDRDLGWRDGPHLHAERAALLLGRHSRVASECLRADDSALGPRMPVEELVRRARWFRHALAVDPLERVLHLEAGCPDAERDEVDRARARVREERRAGLEHAQQLTPHGDRRDRPRLPHEIPARVEAAAVEVRAQLIERRLLGSESVRRVEDR